MRHSVALSSFFLILSACPAGQTDADGDGYFSAQDGGDDCDDSNANISPGADEICDGVDNDCDGVIDGPESTDTIPQYVDGDGDGYGAGDESIACPETDGFAPNNLDCDDTDAAIHPGALDAGLKDRNCDGIHQGWFSAGPQHFCGITNGEIRCYGRDDAKQITDAPTGSNFIQVSAGGQLDIQGNHSCALTDTGSLTCWGGDEKRQVSDTPITGTYKWVATGNDHTCALGENGASLCWGALLDGALEAPEGVFFETLEVGGFHNCGRDTEGVVQCWGIDNFQQVSKPTGLTADKVVTGQYHTCILQEGAITCWGYDIANQITDTPTDANFVDIVAGGYHNCGLHDDGSLTCWGSNADNQSAPPTGIQYAAFSARDNQTCAADSDGYVRCWGLNDYGQAPACLGTLWPDVGEPNDIVDIGLYDDISTHTVASSIQAFAPKFTLWSDGSEKSRWVYLPECATIDNSDEDNWVLPVGTRLFKEFQVDGKRIETRMIQFRAPDGDNDIDDGILYASYQWDAAESSATLWDPETGVADAASYATGVTHDIPSRFECQQCHGGTGYGGVPARALGFSAVQLTDGANLSMKTLSDEGWLTHPNPDGVKVPGDATEQAAIGSLHANCGNCHNVLGEGVFFADGFDLLLSANDTDIKDTGAWNTSVGQPTTLYRTVEYRIDPGNLANSGLYVRMAHRAVDAKTVEYPQMPPIGTKVQDTAGLAELEAWILALGE